MKTLKLSEIKKSIRHFSISKNDILGGGSFDGFAGACYNDNTLAELRDGIDTRSQSDWELTDAEYLDAIRDATINLIAENIRIKENV